MQAISLILDLLQCGWYLLYYISFYIGILAAIYYVFKDVILNSEYNWFSKIIITILIFLILLASHIYWRINYYYPITSDAVYNDMINDTEEDDEDDDTEDEVADEPLPKTEENKEYHSTIDELNALAKESHGDPYEAGVKHLQK